MVLSTNLLFEVWNSNASDSATLLTFIKQPCIFSLKTLFCLISERLFYTGFTVQLKFKSNQSAHKSLSFPIGEALDSWLPECPSKTLIRL